ncbi:hypothetical protein G7046_g3795 [Stylonectria norvegica]|nr:hypothetical protein G7046_g3795 [Stylonectria norvegica]
MATILQSENHPTSRRKPHENRARTRIEVWLPSKPRDYVPGSGPALQPLGILPLRDSTAYILERLLLPSPGPAANGKPLPKRMAYLVGWHDLPAARMFVPAMQVLDYVSPQALEEWEWQMELELDEERPKLEAEAAQELTKPKKRRGRPPASTQIEAAVTAEPELQSAGSAGWSKKGVMSITTPTKLRLEDYEELSEEESSPSRQIERELMGESMDVDANGFSDEMETDPWQAKADRLADEMQLESSNESWPEDYASAGSRITNGNDPRLATSETRLFTPSMLGSRDTATSRVSPAAPTVRAGEAKGPATISQLGHAPAFGGLANGSTQQRLCFAALGQGFPAPAPRLEIGLERHFEPESRSGSSKKKSRAKQKAEPSARKPRKEKPVKAPKVEILPTGEAAWEVKCLEGMEWFEVEGRGLTRYFRVRWEGDWPKDQNPSWEPEDNLPVNLVHNYLRNGKRKRISLGDQKKKPRTKQTTLPWGNGKQYKSVSEAFEGDDTAALAGDQIDAEEEAVNGGEELEELFVVEENPVPNNRAGPAWNGNGLGQLGSFPIWR